MILIVHLSYFYPLRLIEPAFASYCHLFENFLFLSLPLIAPRIETLEANYKDDSTHTILVEYYLVSVGNLDTVSQTLSIDLSVQWWWIDRSLKGSFRFFSMIPT